MSGIWRTAHLSASLSIYFSGHAETRPVLVLFRTHSQVGRVVVYSSNISRDVSVEWKENVLV